MYNYIKWLLSLLFKEYAAMIEQTLSSAEINIEIEYVAILTPVILTMTDNDSFLKIEKQHSSFRVTQYVCPGEPFSI